MLVTPPVSVRCRGAVREGRREGGREGGRERRKGEVEGSGGVWVV